MWPFQNNPILCRIGTAYLAAVSLCYLLVGILGAIPNWDLIAGSVWYRLISPYPILALVRGFFGRWSIYGIAYQIVPASDGEFRNFSILVIAVSLIAFAAAVGIARELNAAHIIWLLLLILSGIESLGYIVADFADWGGVPRGGTHSVETAIALVWCASYVIAYLIARAACHRTPTDGRSTLNAAGGSE